MQFLYVGLNEQTAQISEPVCSGSRVSFGSSIGEAYPRSAGPGLALLPAKPSTNSFFVEGQVCFNFPAHPWICPWASRVSLGTSWIQTVNPAPSQGIESWLRRCGALASADPTARERRPYRASSAPPAVCDPFPVRIRFDLRRESTCPSREGGAGEGGGPGWGGTIQGGDGGSRVEREDPWVEGLGWGERIKSESMALQIYGWRSKLG